MFGGKSWSMTGKTCLSKWSVCFNAQGPRQGSHRKEGMLVFEDSGFGALLALVLLAGALGGRPETLQVPDADYASSAAAPDCPCPALLAARLRLETARSLGARVAVFSGSPPPELDPAGGAAAEETRTLVLSAAAECPDSVRQDQAAVQLAVRVRAELQVRVPERSAACRAPRCAF